MLNIYIQEVKKETSRIGKILQRISKFLHRIKIEKIGENQYIYSVYDLQDKKLEQRISRKLPKNDPNEIQIILAKSCKFLTQIKGGKMVTGKKIERIFLPSIFDYIAEQMEEENFLQTQDIFFLVKKASIENVQLIEYFVEKSKTVNIITTDIKAFQKLEEKWQVEKGIWTTVANNKKKSLKKASWIINLDFEKEEVAAYQINRNAIFINMVPAKIEAWNGFEGMIIQNIEIGLEENIPMQLQQDFTAIEIYESIFPFSMDYYRNVNEMETHKVRIIQLVGNKGILDTKEIRNYKKILTN